MAPHGPSPRPSGRPYQYRGSADGNLTIHRQHLPTTKPAQRTKGHRATARPPIATVDAPLGHWQMSSVPPLSRGQPRPAAPFWNAPRQGPGENWPRRLAALTRAPVSTALGPTRPFPLSVVGPRKLDSSPGADQTKESFRAKILSVFDAFVELHSMNLPDLDWGKPARPRLRPEFWCKIEAKRARASGVCWDVLGLGRKATRPVRRTAAAHDRGEPVTAFVLGAEACAGS